MVCRDFILPEFCKPCLFYLLFNLRKLLYLIEEIDMLVMEKLSNCAVCNNTSSTLHFGDKRKFIVFILFSPLQKRKVRVSSFYFLQYRTMLTDIRL